jgi:hypothetical protein
MSNGVKNLELVMSSLRWLESKRDNEAKAWVMEEEIIGKEKMSLAMRLAERFAQAFLKLDAWCESMKGLKVEEGEENSQ